jgi:very-short-patch-repair endonuclease
LVEIDGIHHGDAQQAWDGAQRQNDLWVRGERILRFPAWVVRERPAAFVATLRRGLEERAGFPAAIDRSCRSALA